MESYEFDDKAGGEFADLLIAARGRGVEVNLIYDAWGAKETSVGLVRPVAPGRGQRARIQSAHEFAG